MEAYSALAAHYDALTDDVQYDAWADYAEHIFARLGVSPKLVLDLACGTGSLSLRMAQRGYEMIGVDLSPDMLAAASQSAGRSSSVRTWRSSTCMERSTRRSAAWTA